MELRTRQIVDDLVRRAVSGDRDAFGSLYALFKQDVHDYCTRRVGVERADDLAHDVFERAMRAIPRYEQRDRFWPWLRTIAANACIDELRHRRVVPLVALAQVEAELDHAAAAEEQALRRVVGAEFRSDLRQGMARLHPRAAAIVRQRLAGISYAAIAHRYTSTIPSVRTTLSKATGQLRSHLRARGWPDRSLGLVPFIVGWLRSAGRRTRDAAARVHRPIPSCDVLVHALSVAAFGVAAALSPVAPAAAIPGSAIARATEQAAPSATNPLEQNPAPRLASSGAHSRVAASGPREEGHRVGPARVSATTNYRDRTVAPSETRASVEVYGPDGSLLYRDETGHDCHLESHILPSNGPVRAYC